MKIFIDHREKNSLVAAGLVSLGVEIEFRHLILGDYVISEKTVIERKTIDDFITSMINKRLIKQLEDMKSNFKNPILMIEGLDQEDLYRPSSHPGINENSVRGMILSVAADFNVPMIFTKDSSDTAKYLMLLAKKEEGGKKEFSFKVKRKAFSPKERKQMIIEGFPGIGPSLAKNLLDHFKSIKAFMNSTEEELMEVPKLGKKKAKIIKDLIDQGI